MQLALRLCLLFVCVCVWWSLVFNPQHHLHFWSKVNYQDASYSWHRVQNQEEQCLLYIQMLQKAYCFSTQKWSPNVQRWLLAYCKQVLPVAESGSPALLYCRRAACVWWCLYSDTDAPMHWKYRVHTGFEHLDIRIGLCNAKPDR